MQVIKWIGGIIGVLLLVGIVLAATGKLAPLLFWAFVTWNKPDHDFDPALAVAPPNYSDRVYWAAHPSKADPADLIPEGVEVLYQQGEAPVDVFFIHPTGYLSGESWTSPMKLDSATEENTQWMMGNQASAFNGCCNVYAPRYRQASIFSYLVDTSTREQVLGFAYEDVADAFDYYIEHYNKGKPFLIASHSQGSHHGHRLLREKLDGTSLADRMVAAYMIGSVGYSYSESYFNALETITPCESPAQTGCVIHWDTYGDGGTEPTFLLGDEPSLCTNPLSWTVTTERVEASENLGAVESSGTYNTSVANQTSTGNTPKRLSAPLRNYTWARCSDGRLYVADQQGSVFDPGEQGEDKSYHVLDYQLFHMNIRSNAELRARTFLTTQ